MVFFQTELALCVPPFDFVCCPLQLALGQQGAVLTMVEEFSCSHYPLEVKSRFGRKLWKLPSTSLWRWAVRFDEEIHNFYEISVALTYMGEMSPPTTHWR